MSTLPDGDSSLHEWLTWQEQNHPTEIDMGLERVRTVAERLGVLSPNARVITVAGTNGKGSCVATLEALLCAEGQRYGAYTSPHFLKYNERVRLQGAPVEDSVLVDAFDRIRQACDTISLTYFEYGTLAAMVIFNDTPLDYWLLEVGLGGRLDAVNIVDPNLAVITSIAIDHEAWLGNSREQIGFEKAGIARANALLICADAEPPATVAETARALGCEVKWRGADFDFSIADAASAAGGQLQFRLSDGRTINVGKLQLPSPSVAAALEVMLHEDLLGKEAIERSVVEALESVVLTGRMQRVSLNGTPAILDVAHNPAAAELLAERMMTQFGQKYSAVVAMMADKDIVAVFKPLLPYIDHWYCADLQGNDRAASGLSLQKVLVNDLAVPSERVTAHASVIQAIESAGKPVNTGGSSLIVFGSFFTVAEALSYEAQLNNTTIKQ